MNSRIVGSRAAVQAAVRAHHHQSRPQSRIITPPLPPAPELVAWIAPSGALVSPSAAVVESPTATTNRRATADDYSYVLVPLGTTGFAFAIISEFADAGQAAIWSAAVFLITITAMRDEQFSEIVAHMANWLRGD